MNELTNATRSGTLTVAGLASQPGANISSVSVSVNGGASANADVYADGSWAKSGASLNDGANSYTATATDTYGRTASDAINLSLPSTNNFQYDFNGNLTNDGRRVFEYDYENQLTNVYVASAWRSEFKYDAFGRRRVRKEYTWQSSAWVLTNEVRYLYDGMLVVQERNANNLALVSYTRGNDLSATLQGAGGIGGLLARTDHSTLISQPSAAHAYYHSDGNGNVTAMVDTNGILVAKYNYDPYGNLLGMSGPLAEANTYRFSSKEYAGNAALYYYGFRYYEPNLQRWLNRDPLGESGGMLFQSVGNNPINFIDPMGLFGNPVSGGGGYQGTSSGPPPLSWPWDQQPSSWPPPNWTPVPNLPSDWAPRPAYPGGITDQSYALFDAAMWAGLVKASCSLVKAGVQAGVQAVAKQLAVREMLAAERAMARAAEDLAEKRIMRDAAKGGVLNSEQSVQATAEDLARAIRSKEDLAEAEKAFDLAETALKELQKRYRDAAEKAANCK
ncbi:MAG TPA: RHS repeat-associated core domain-containing protein [Verrucomicrobiae bacterium]|nr:RHS repeat-associated core domain-containing protein [Verrucomicrobiae bacterium]